jgi:hypothetical protein
MTMATRRKARREFLPSAAECRTIRAQGEMGAGVVHSAARNCWANPLSAVRPHRSGAARTKRPGTETPGAAMSGEVTADGA